MFESKGLIVIEKTKGMDDDEMMMIALDAGADDFNADDDMYEIITSPDNFDTVRESLEKQGYSFVKSEVSRIPNMTVNLEGDAVAKFTRMLDMFDENDDVQNVYHNAELPEEEDEE